MVAEPSVCESGALDDPTVKKATEEGFLIFGSNGSALHRYSTILNCLPIMTVCIVFKERMTICFRMMQTTSLLHLCRITDSSHIT